MANCFSASHEMNNHSFLSLSKFPFPLPPTSHINEDKRKTEGQKQIFDVVYEVDGCPVSLSAAIVCMSVVVYIYI